MPNQDPVAFDCFAIVELFGRQQLSGKVTEQVIAGQGFVRLDVPAIDGQPGFTRLFGPGAIYSIIPTSEEIAIAFAKRNVGAPINPWQLSLPDAIHQDQDESDDLEETVDFDTDPAL